MNNSSIGKTDEENCKNKNESKISFEINEFSFSDCISKVMDKISEASTKFNNMLKQIYNFLKTILEIFIKNVSHITVAKIYNSIDMEKINMKKQ